MKAVAAIKAKALTQRARRKNTRSAKLGLGLVFAALLSPVAMKGAVLPGEVKKVIYDQDFSGIIGPDADPLVMLLQAPNVQVLGVP